MTSFSSLGIIKKALATRKVGHTGTLDSFADGLLVVAVGESTKLVPYITDLDKTYDAIIRFGFETDTLDPTGTKVDEPYNFSAPTRTVLEKALSHFYTGCTTVIEQVPPLYSALHIQGVRASDLARKGKVVDIPSRTVTIYNLELCEYAGEYAHIRVHCSKGTYIRSLTRDIARLCNSRAHTAALRRTAVGSFLLTDAVDSETLPPFSISSLCPQIKSDIVRYEDTEILKAAIRAHVSQFTPAFAQNNNFALVYLKPHFCGDFYNGKPINSEWFSSAILETMHDKPIAVYTLDMRFAGLIQYCEERIRYLFVSAHCRDGVS